MSLSGIIIDWYLQNKRDLPWRRTSDPYRIWISEIILQQTRVDQGMDYYLRFIDRYPAVSDLASADEKDVLRLWQGLGYYARARNMLFAARQVMNEFGGEFPQDYTDLIKLRGVGDYTASAVASIAFNKPFPVTDGNVMRVISRLNALQEPVNTGAGMKEVRINLEKIFDPASPGIFNQALMEFGALLCKPKNPDCGICPLKNKCMALHLGMVGELPRKDKNTRMRKRYFNYLVLLTGQPEDVSFLLRKRKSDDIWKNLYEFPMVESDRILEYEDTIHDGYFRYIKNKETLVFLHQSGLYKHQLSHQKLFARFFMVRMERPGKDAIPGNYEETNISDIQNYPLPRLIDRYLHEEFLPYLKKN